MPIDPNPKLGNESHFVVFLFLPYYYRYRGLKAPREKGVRVLFFLPLDLILTVPFDALLSLFSLTSTDVRLP